jgi:hypothetical protein
LKYVSTFSAFSASPFAFQSARRVPFGLIVVVGFSFSFNRGRQRLAAALLVDGLNDPARGALSFTSEELIFNFCFFKFWSASYMT